jgi:hypothetical protein
MSPLPSHVSPPGSRGVPKQSHILACATARAASVSEYLGRTCSAHSPPKPGGFGHAETIGQHSRLFAVSDKKYRIDQKKVVSTPAMTSAVGHPAPAPARKES